jgi:hypothetical protein
LQGGSVQFTHFKTLVGDVRTVFNFLILTTKQYKHPTILLNTIPSLFFSNN